MKPLTAILSTTTTAIIVAASIPQNPIMSASNKNTLPIQPPDHDTLYENHPPPPPIKFQTAHHPPSQESSKSTSNTDKYSPKTSPVSLADTIGPLRQISSFSSFTRLSSTTTSLLADLSSHTTVLAPLNSAIDNLPRKPWESPSDYKTFGAQVYDGTGGQDRANRNLLRFVEAHFVTKSPWGEGDKVKTLAGREVWWEEKDGERVIMPDGVVVDRVASRVENGELWLIKGVVNYE